MNDTQQDPYIIEGGKTGSDRLFVLANATWPTTKDFLIRAGLKRGMRCLDLGCGNGEISLRIASEIICSTGHVMGIDMDPNKIEIAKQKARRNQLKNTIFETADITNQNFLADKFDFILLRFILSHLNDPEKLVKNIRPLLKPNGILAVEDVDFNGHHSRPLCHAFERYVELYKTAAQHCGADATIGAKISEILTSADYKILSERAVTPEFFTGDGKQMAWITMGAISKNIVDLRLTTQNEINQIMKDLKDFTDDFSTMMSLPTVYQVSSHL